jgi:hypothetical protein
VAEQPGRSVAFGQRRVNQPGCDLLAAPLRGNEQAGQPVIATDGRQVHPTDYFCGTRHPLLAFTGGAHARAVLAVEMVQQAALGWGKASAGQREHAWFTRCGNLRQEFIGALSQIVANAARVNVRLRGSTISGGE